MANRRKLSDTTIQTALKAIEAMIRPPETVGGAAPSIDEEQALFDARRELSAMIGPPKAGAVGGKARGSKSGIRSTTLTPAEKASGASPNLD